jgi:predicted PurR-regulated permease PerM
MTPGPQQSVGRIGWWFAVGTLAALLGFVAVNVLGTLVLGLFVHYVVRPLDERVSRSLPADTAATVTFLGVVFPLLAVVGYIAVVASQELLAAFSGRSLTVSTLLEPYLDGGISDTRRTTVEAALDDPVGLVTSNTDAARQVLDAALAFVGAASGLLFVLFVAAAVDYFLLQDGDRLYRWSRAYLLDEESVLDAYLRAVDRDLETVFLGNVFTVGLVAVAAAVVYNAYNLVAPAPVEMPIPTALALVTGLASFVPIVVGKLV